MTDLPSLNALRAFEAAARHLSFKAAGRELHVTPGAVSQQVKALEEELGVSLFRRLTRAIVLTPQGQVLRPKVVQAFQLLSAAVEGLRPAHQPGVLTVSTFPSFAAKWLVPRLGRFAAQQPDVDVRISSTPGLVDFGREAVDVAVRQGQGNWPGLESVLLFNAELFPVASPKLLKEGLHPLREPADLRYHTLLHSMRESEWRLWLQAHGVRGVDATRGPRFSDDALALEAAIEGQGVAISRDILVAGDLAAGVLVRPFPQAMPDLFGCYLVVPAERVNEPHIAAFRDWIVDEARRNPLPRR
ncbi:MAG TPA: transcriptional regulator GcvA [bacterium]|nr:transcriptional regulator GcvA [bacterium]